ncbi:hypothetical protein SanJ4211_0601 [Streptococcus anginosus]|nr:hypothetical protein SanJ4211_0601 [Streptococcus anginosus]
MTAIFIMSRFIWFFLTRGGMLFDLAETIILAIVLFISSFYLFGKIDKN